MAGANGTSGAGHDEEGQVRGTREGQKDQERRTSPHHQVGPDTLGRLVTDVFSPTASC